MQQEKEIWRPVKGYEKLYAISSFGNVKSFYFNQLLVPKYKNRGYAFVVLSKNNIQKSFHIHRLVAFGFIPNPDNKKYVLFRDLNKKNMHVSNLLWGNKKELNSTSLRPLNYPRNSLGKGIGNPRSVPIMQLSVNNEMLFVWENMTIASQRYGLKGSTAIRRAVRLHTVSIGFKWKDITKEFYHQHKDQYLNPPDPVVSNIRKRDLSAVKEAKRKKVAATTPEFFLQHGVWCYRKYGSIIRSVYDNYAKEKKIYRYHQVLRHFKNWDEFKEKVMAVISPPLVQP